MESWAYEFITYHLWAEEIAAWNIMSYFRVIYLKISLWGYLGWNKYFLSHTHKQWIIEIQTGFYGVEFVLSFRQFIFLQWNLRWLDYIAIPISAAISASFWLYTGSFKAHNLQTTQVYSTHCTTTILFVTFFCVAFLRSELAKLSDPQNIAYNNVVWGWSLAKSTALYIN